MIGGYIYNKLDPDIHHRLRNKLDDAYQTIPVWGNGYFFYDNSFEDDSNIVFKSEDLLLMSQDFLVASSSDGEYRHFDVQVLLKNSGHWTKAESRVNLYHIPYISKYQCLGRWNPLL